MDDFNPYAAPEAGLAPQHFATEEDEGRGVWRDGKTLVMAKAARLPSRCVRCNEPATFRLKRTLSWHTPLLYVLLISPLIYVIVALIFRQTAKVQIPLCERHRAKRSKAIATCWLVALAGFALCFAPVFNSDLMPLIGVGTLMILGALVGALFIAVVTPRKIDKTHAWLDKVSPLYLATLPKLPTGEDEDEDDVIKKGDRRSDEI